MANVLERAIRVAVEAHEGQVDKLGEPYILHPLRLMVKASTLEAKVVAVLHDVVEDCGPHWAGVARAICAEIGIEPALAAVTKKPKGEETYFEFMRRARDAGPVAREVKILDVEDHIERAKTPELKGMVKTRYVKALRILRYRDN